MAQIQFSSSQVHLLSLLVILSSKEIFTVAIRCSINVSFVCLEIVHFHTKYHHFLVFDRFNKCTRSYSLKSLCFVLLFYTVSKTNNSYAEQINISSEAMKLSMHFDHFLFQSRVLDLSSTVWFWFDLCWRFYCADS